MSEFDDEYALFQLEIENLGGKTDSKNEPESNAPDSTPQESTAQLEVQNEPVELPDIENELNYLKGHKCQAPYSSKHEENDETRNASYHNALVISVHTPESGVSDINEIYVKVVFTHPIYKSMLTCPYYLDGDCKYSEEKCHFSHGYLVKFIELKEYNNICYDNLQIGQLVLGKNLQNNIWYRAKIINFNLKEDKVIIQFETGEGKKGHGKNNIEMDLENIYPLDSGENITLEPVESRESSEENTDFDDEVGGGQQFEAIEISLNNKPLDTRLGYWEKHTKGMGSKLMMKMGYIVGTGLGKNCKGRIEPVETFILPQGKSLDYCMNLKEKHGGSCDMFKMEKINRKMESKTTKQNKKNYDKSIKKEKSDVFSFLNRNLNQSKSVSGDGSATPASANLNIETFKIAERIKKFEKQLYELNKSLNRHEKGSEVYEKVYKEICAVNSEIRGLNMQETRIHDQMKKHSNTKQMMKF